MLFNLIIHRGRPGEHRHWQAFPVEVSPDAYLLDTIQAAWSQDRTLAFRHACHHASCGSCAVLVNGREQLPCVTRAAEAAGGGRGVIRLEPLRNFPHMADLVVDRSAFLGGMRSAGMQDLCREATPQTDALERFEDCIECGICVSACPVAGADPAYLGPAALAAAERAICQPHGLEPSALAAHVDSRHGVWRCHGIFECSEACPQDVEPAASILRLRRYLATGNRD